MAPRPHGQSDVVGETGNVAFPALCRSVNVIIDVGRVPGVGFCRRAVRNSRPSRGAIVGKDRIIRYLNRRRRVWRNPKESRRVPLHPRSGSEIDIDDLANSRSASRKRFPSSKRRGSFVEGNALTGSPDVTRKPDRSCSGIDDFDPVPPISRRDLSVPEVHHQI